MKLDRIVHKSALISDDEQYRYTLSRVWDWAKPLVSFIMLNPSTADAESDDPTLRRCMAFAEREGFGGILIGNLFAFRSPSPRTMRSAMSPIGPDNNHWLGQIAWMSSAIVLAWGSGGSFLNRDKEVVGLLQTAQPLAPIKCLGLTKGGHPKHPLYLPSNTELINFIRDE